MSDSTTRVWGRQVIRWAARLLLIEAEPIRRLLSNIGPDMHEAPTPCGEWSVCDVVAHCGAVLNRLARGSVGSFAPEDNQRDIAQRRSWSFELLLSDYVDNLAPAAAIIDRLDGLVDGIGLGEWIHGGDIRAGVGAQDAYASAGVDLAIELISIRSAERCAPSLEVDVDGIAVPFGVGACRGRVVTDAATFVRAVAGRAPDRSRYELSDGVGIDDLRLFS